MAQSSCLGLIVRLKQSCLKPLLSFIFSAAIPLKCFLSSLFSESVPGEWCSVIRLRPCSPLWPDIGPFTVWLGCFFDPLARESMFANTDNVCVWSWRVHWCYTLTGGIQYWHVTMKGGHSSLISLSLSVSHSLTHSHLPSPGSSMLHHLHILHINHPMHEATQCKVKFNPVFILKYFGGV